MNKMVEEMINHNQQFKENELKALFGHFGIPSKDIWNRTLSFLYSNPEKEEILVDGVLALTIRSGFVEGEGITMKSTAYRHYLDEKTPEEIEAQAQENSKKWRVTYNEIKDIIKDANEEELESYVQAGIEHTFEEDDLRSFFDKIKVGEEFCDNIQAEEVAKELWMVFDYEEGIVMTGGYDEALEEYEARTKDVRDYVMGTNGEEIPADERIILARIDRQLYNEESVDDKTNEAYYTLKEETYKGAE